MTKYNISFVNHIIELKYRIIYTLLSGSFVFLISYLYSLELFYFVAKPLINLKVSNFEYSLIYTDITEAFFTYLYLSFYISFGIIVINLIHHLTKFVTPGLFYKEFVFLQTIKKFGFFLSYVV